MARFHELALLCHKHATSCKLPDLNPEASIQGQIERKADEFFAEKAARKRKKLFMGKNLFFPGMSGGCLTTREAQFIPKLRDTAELHQICISVCHVMCERKCTPNHPCTGMCTRCSMVQTAQCCEYIHGL